MDAWSTSFSTPSPSDGPVFSGELALEGLHESEVPKGRASERVPLEIGAGLRQRGASGVSIQVMDLSIHGFRAATHLDLPPGTDVWLRLPGLEPFHAKVAWSKGHFIGCAFERPLHPAVLDMIVRKVRTR
jgi:hypothetical protein